MADTPGGKGSKLFSLPLELFDQILEDLDPSDKPTFARLALVNKAFNALATPHLYRAVSFTEDGRAASFRSFARSILGSCGAGRKDLALMVQDLAMTYLTSELQNDSSHSFEALQEEVRKWTPASFMVDTWLECLPPPDPDSSPHETNANLFELLIALCLPNLTKLVLEGYFVDSTWHLLEEILVFLQTQLDQSLRREEVWPKLEEITIQGAGGKYPDSAWPVVLFIARFPWVKRIYGSDLGPAADGIELHESFDAVRQGKSNVQSLFLEPHCQLNSLELDTLLGAPIALKEFRYNVGHTWAWTPLKTKDLQESLERQSRTLETLSLTHNYYEFMKEDFGDLDDDMNPMTFAAFTALKTLEISLPFVFGHEPLQFGPGIPQREGPEPTNADLRFTRLRLVEMLPRSIEILRFAQCGDVWATKRLDHAMLELFKCQSKRFPRLRTIEVHGYPPICSQGLLELRKSVVEAKRTGIELLIFEGGLLGIDDVHGGWYTGQIRERTMTSAKLLDILVEEQNQASQ